MSKKANFTIKPDLVQDMINVFDGERPLLAALNTNRTTWKKIVDCSGVKEGTTTAIVRHFFRILIQIRDGKNSNHQVFDHIALALCDKYSEALTKPKYDDLLDKITTS